tara:strand:- start:2419 stop:3111 length:693 start_codon:yes stop_codon:yes gene_type:complete
MVTRVTILILLFTFFISDLSAQEAKKISYRKQCKIDSKRQILEIHDGVLLIRLKQKQKSIDALRKRGREKLATKVELKQKNRNKYIIDAFNARFDFCPVYFFYSSDSKHVRKNNLDSISFLNDSLLKDNSITFKDSIFYVAEFGHIEPEETFTYQSSTHLSKGETRSTYSGSSDFSFKAVTVKTKDFKQLKEPFAYYSKESSGANKRANINNAVSKLDLILKRFYSKQVK